MLEAVQDIRSIVPKVPQDLDTESRKKAVGLLYNKAILQRQREAIAPELRGKIDKEIEKIDTQLKNLIEGAVAVQLGLCLRVVCYVCVASYVCMCVPFIREVCHLDEHHLDL